MSNTLRPALEQENVWFVLVPKQQEFAEPIFHFGERVKWFEQNEEGQRSYRSGRIIGMSFQSGDWHYIIYSDDISGHNAPLIHHRADELKLVKDAASIRDQLTPTSPWKMTAPAAAQLGISAEQLRNLRRNRLFKVGIHYRDTSVPGSGKPRWQWHVERCAQALAIPPEKR